MYPIEWYRYRGYTFSSSNYSNSECPSTVLPLKKESIFKVGASPYPMNLEGSPVEGYF
jgi:hypothetical protein